jgi:hypothetical protein
LEGVKPKPYDEQKITNDKIYIAKKLDISIDEFEQILALKPKWYTDYPNDEKRLDFIYNLYRKIYKKEKLASF